MGWQDRDYGSEEAYYGMTGRRWAVLATRLSLSGVLIIINIAIFVLDSLMRDPGRAPVLEAGAMETSLVLRGQLWRLITSQYLHVDGMHLFMNMLGLYFLGRYLEERWGRRRFLIFYTICGTAGNVFYMLLNLVGWLDPGYAVGASGCILGVLGACAVLFPGIQLIVFLFPMKIRTAAGLFLALYTYNLLSRGGNAGGDAAHLAGMVVGAGYAFWTRGSHRRAHSFRPIRVTRVAVDPTSSSWLPTTLRDDPLNEEVDRILAKIREQGLASLTDSEKQTLAQASGKR